MIKFYDTSALLDGGPDIFLEPIPFLISLTTLQELESIKSNKNKSSEVKYKARRLLGNLLANPRSYEIVYFQEALDYLKENGIPCTNDNIIMAEAVLYENKEKTKIMFVTSDVSCHFLAINIFGLATKLFTPNVGSINYTGYAKVKMTDSELADFYTECEDQPSPKTINTFNILTNQYVALESDHNVVVDIYRWNGEEYTPLIYDTIKSNYLGNVMPRNLEQKMAFDLLQNNEITIKILTGKFGSGKTYLMLAHALHLLQTGEIDKIVYMRNGVKVKDVADIGMLPGTAQEKLLPGAMPLVDHLGGLDALLKLIQEEKIELVDLGMVRGRSWNNAIILCGEAENLTTQHVQLLIGRVGENSQLWIDGDYKQTDARIFEANNGLMTAIDKLKGRKLFGYVKLQKTERSITASLADLLD